MSTSGLVTEELQPPSDPEPATPRGRPRRWSPWCCALVGDRADGARPASWLRDYNHDGTVSTIVGASCWSCSACPAGRPSSLRVRRATAAREPAGATTSWSRAPADLGPRPRGRADRDGVRRGVAHRRGAAHLRPGQRRRGRPDLLRIATRSSRRSRTCSTRSGPTSGSPCVAEMLVLVFGLLVAIMRMLPGRAGAPLRLIAAVYCDVFRAHPGDHRHLAGRLRHCRSPVPRPAAAGHRPGSASSR